MVKPVKVGHLVLNVRDVEASERFYTEILGFEVAIKRPNAVFLTCGTVHHDLALFEAPVDATRGELGLNHFAVQIGGLEDLKETYQLLKEQGVAIDKTVDHGMTGSVYFSDPDGNKIEFFYDKCESDEEGLALMRTPDRVNTELVLEDVRVAQ